MLELAYSEEWAAMGGSIHEPTRKSATLTTKYGKRLNSKKGHGGCNLQVKFITGRRRVFPSHGSGRLNNWVVASTMPLQCEAFRTKMLMGRLCTRRSMLSDPPTR